MNGRRVGMLLGFLAAFVGDWFLAVKGSPRGSAGFLYGVAAFSLAHVCRGVGHLREARPDLRVLTALAVPLGFFVVIRLWPAVNGTTAAAILAYTFLSAAHLALALATRRRFYAAGIACLLASDVLIGCRWLDMPFARELVGPVYLLSEVLLAVSFFLRDESRLDFRRANPFAGAVLAGAAAWTCFLLAMAVFPGGGYNPCFRMLSALGRTEVRLVEWPLSHFLFTAGLLSAAWGVARQAAILPRWGCALNVAGLLTIAAIPENVNMLGHNAGCWLAAIGGTVLLWKGRRDSPFQRLSALALVVSCCALAFGLGLHALKVVPFAPWVPTPQKALILSFMAWILAQALPWSTRRAVRLSLVLAAAGVVLSFLPFVEGTSAVPPAVPRVQVPPSAAPVRTADVSDDRLQAALSWLEHVTGPLSATEEAEWWTVGGRQYGIFAKRYNIAFAGYAAAAIGLLAEGEDGPSAALRRRVGSVLARCIERYLKTDVWAYSQSKSYWGRKPWAPDPCYRENVMYTGHLLQLLAFYELFTGDTRYWTEGFDFVWKKTRVHYTVQKLIDVTVRQMRKGPNGGVTCEPGLMFFPCNNHPHYALRIFARLGHGDWTNDALRWERWALGHFRRPFLGGGALNLVYHVRSGLMYPRGSAGLDGWALLWYAAWASDRSAVRALWREAVAEMDVERLCSADDVKAGANCCDPEPVAPSVAAVFLAAAARACGDGQTAERLEKAVDARHLVRKNGWLYLDLARDWRIGATAHRIIALAQEMGMDFRRAWERTDSLSAR